MKKYTKILLIGLLAGVIFSILPIHSFASGISITPDLDILPRPDNTDQNSLINNTVPAIATILTGLAAAIALIMLIISGVRMVTMYGNDDQIATAKNQIVYSIVGFLIALLAFAIVRIVINFRVDTASTPPSTIPAITEETP